MRYLPFAFPGPSRMSAGDDDTRGRWMTSQEPPAAEFDCRRFTPDAATLANALWADGDLSAVLVDADRRLLAYNHAARPSLDDEQVRVGGKLAERLTTLWLDDEEQECEPSRQPLERAFAGEAVHRQVIRFDTASYQEQGRMRVSAQPVALHDGSQGVMVCWQDITERWHNQRRDRREIRRLEQLLDGASDYVILMLDTSGVVLSWSRSAEVLHGYPAEEGVGLPYGVLFTEVDEIGGREVAARLLRTAESEGSARTDGLRRRKDGSTFWAEGSLTVLRDEDGDPSGFVEVAHDITQKQEAEQEILSLNQRLAGLNHDLERRIAERTEQLVRQAADLQATNDELESFSHSVSHNLRAPLRAVAGYARLAEDKFGPEMPAGALEYLRKLNSSALLMGRLIDGLLALSRTQRTALSIETLDMTPLAQECWEALADEREGREIEFSLGQLPPAEGDRRLIYQVWMNLLQNAIKYTGRREHSRITVEADERDGVTWYRVEDNGVGFDMKYAHKIGEVFQRLHDGSDFPGTGIGMASVQRIVQRHGGGVTVHGEIGVGARIEFSLWGRP